MDSRTQKNVVFAEGPHYSSSIKQNENTCLFSFKLRMKRLIRFFLRNVLARFVIFLQGIDDFIWEDMDNTYPVGTSFTSITGMLHYAYGNYKIVPRNAADLVTAN